MKELRSIKKGASKLLMRHPLNPIQQVGAISLPSPRQHLAVQRFFDTCHVKLSRIVSDPEKIDGLSVMPEVAFMGRSNVGKSSLLNALLYPLRHDKSAVDKRDYARVANHPGFTKTLNFYTCGQQVRIVDMPGYGYGSKTDQGNLIRTYLEHQRSLRRVYLLASCKEGLTDLDQMAIDILTEVGVPWQLVYTKLDKLITKPEKLSQESVASPSSKVSQKQAFLSKLTKTAQNSSSIKHNPSQIEALSLKDTVSINDTIKAGLDLIEPNPAVFAQVIGTSATKRLNYLGIPQLRTSIFQACGLLRK